MTNQPNQQSRVARQRAEAAGGNADQPSKIKFRGHTYTVPAQSKWTLDTLEYLSEIDDNPLLVVKVIRELLGNEYKAFKDRHNNVGALNDFFQEFQAVLERENGSPN